MPTKPNAYYAKRSRDKLAQKGGRIIRASLRKEEADALAAFRHAGGFETDTEAVRAAIVEAAKKAGARRK